MKSLLAVTVLLLAAAGPQCEQRGTTTDAGFDAGRRDGGALGDGGNPWDGGWDPNLPDGGYPGSGRNGDPGMDVVFLVPMDRGLANDAALYVSLVDQVRGALAAAGLGVLETVVAAREDGRPIWAQARNLQPPVKLLDVLTYYAQTLPDQSTPCSTTGLAQLGANMPYELIAYPTELTGVPSYDQPFAIRASALLVVMLDRDVRPAPITASSCVNAQAAPAAYFGGSSDSQWLSWRLPRPTTRFWVISTPEDGTPTSTMRQACLATGYPATALDTIAPSAVPFHDPWAQGMNTYFPELMTRADLCSALTGHLPAKALADAWAKVLRAQVGLP